MIQYLRSGMVIAGALAFAATARSVTHHVYTAADLAALPTLAAGDIAILHDGVYDAVDKQITASGTASAPAYFYAENLGQAVFSGSTQLRFAGSHLIVAGLRFDGTVAQGATR